MIDAQQSRFDFRRQGLTDNIRVEAAEVLAYRAQKFLVGDHGNSAATLDAASHFRLQITASVQVAMC